MQNEGQITKNQFTKRLVDLCLKSGMSGFPKDDLDQHILLKSAVLTLDPSRSFPEKEINEKLKQWIDNISRIQKLDHSSLRRWLVDAGYLTRTSDGSSYRVAAGSRPERFEAAIDEIDVQAAIDAAREEIARRKQAYLARAKS